MTLYKTNFDYEYQLQNFKNDQLDKSLEHLFFWTCHNGDILKTDNSYSREYLSYIASKRGFKITLGSHSERPAQSWWGSLVDIELERKFNSNWSFFKWVVDNDLTNEKIVFHEQAPLVLDNNYYYKKDFGFSGKSFLNESQKDFKNIIQIPKLDRINDYSIVYDENKELILLEHEIGSQLNWTSVQYSQDNVNEAYAVINKWITTFNPSGIFSLDFFSHKKNGQNEIFYSEINYRKTMGWVFLNIKKQFPNAKKMMMTKKAPSNYLLSLSPREFKHKFFVI